MSTQNNIMYDQVHLEKDTISSNDEMKKSFNSVHDLSTMFKFHSFIHTVTCRRLQQLKNHTPY